MSSCTHINGTITVSPMGRTQAEKRYVLDTVLQHLPLVIGSRGNMNVYVVQKNGHDSLSCYDEFGQITNNLLDTRGNRSRKRGLIRTQSEYILIINDYFEDRTFEKTFKEFQKWICRLAKRVIVGEMLIEIKGSGKSTILRNYLLQDTWDNVYGQMNEKPTWCYNDGETHEPNWCEYLLWDRARNSDLPALLEYKYIVNKENDEEVERRILYHKD